VTSVDQRTIWIWLVVALLCVMAWVYVAISAYGMEHMEFGAKMFLMPSMDDWQLKDLILVLLMWTVMMAAMMLPSTVTMLRSFVDVGQRMEVPRAPRDTLGFVAGYLIAWTAYSLFATLLQWKLLEVRLVSPMMQASSIWLSGALLLTAGAYQFTPWKERCLRGCRSPISFLAHEWRPELAGAVRMGWRHGLECIGCCWVLMLLLFVLGVMNFAWNIVLAALVIFEKHVPRERWFLRITGAAFIMWGTIIIATGAMDDTICSPRKVVESVIPHAH
jgi:predicted metal-binding membrane protein